MILIADASALIALSACNSLPVLDALFGKVLVPEAVYLEVAAEGKPHSEPLRHYLHGKVRQVDMQNFVFLDAYADAGETAAMLLYKELEADYLLIDDKRGRKGCRTQPDQDSWLIGCAASSQKGRADCVHRTLACAN